MTDTKNTNVSIREPWKMRTDEVVPQEMVAISVYSNGNTRKEATKTAEKFLGGRIENGASPVKNIHGDCKVNLANRRIALIVVDFQNDFVDGSLKIGDGDAAQDPKRVIPSLNELLKQNWDLVVYTKDWHPANHISYLSQARNADRELQEMDRSRSLRVFDTVQFVKPNKLEQMLYPDHCIQHSWGSDIHADLHLTDNAKYVMKGVDSHLDSYSAFFDNNGHSKTELEDLLKGENIDAVVVAGLAYDICVRFTCLDAIKLNFLTAVVPECSAGLTKKGVEEAEAVFRQKGVAIVSKDTAVSIAQRAQCPIEWVPKLQKY